MLILSVSLLTGCVGNGGNISTNFGGLFSDQRALSVLGSDRLKIIGLNIRESKLVELSLQKQLSETSLRARHEHYKKENGDKISAVHKFGIEYSPLKTVGIKCRSLRISVKLSTLDSSRAVEAVEVVQNRGIVCFDTIHESKGWQRSLD